MTNKLRLGVLISGRGSNLQALIDACAKSDFPAEIVMVISNKGDAQGLDRARSADIPTCIVDHRNYDHRAAFDTEMTWALEDSKVDLVCLAGFMRLLSEEFVEHWWDKLINIHPSLLPAFKGLDVQRRAIKEGAKFSGCTLHYVRHEMDVGPIVTQAVVPIHATDTPDSLAKKILEQEHKIYPAAVKWIAEGRVHIDGERAHVEDAETPDALLINPTA